VLGPERAKEKGQGKKREKGQGKKRARQSIDGQREHDQEKEIPFAGLLAQVVVELSAS
jgi:hypothetical protein